MQLHGKIGPNLKNNFFRKFCKVDFGEKNLKFTCYNFN